MQAAIGCEQLQKLPMFVECRRRNWDRLRENLSDTADKLILPEPAPNSVPSWFGFMMTVREGISREKMVRFIEDKGIQTRMLFSGNLIKHPCFDQLRKSGEGYRVVGSLENTDRVMRDSFWVGVYPGMTDEMIDYIAQIIRKAAEKV